MDLTFENLRRNFDTKMDPKEKTACIFLKLFVKKNKKDTNYKAIVAEMLEIS